MEAEAMSTSTRFDWLFRPQPAGMDLPLSAAARFAEALAKLPAVERSALALSEIGGLDTNEIAKRLGTDSALVRKLLLRARESVRTSEFVHGRGSLPVLLPFQNLWENVAPSAPPLSPLP
jgi:DNA-directed RNA polymerase specialized sigma24 family protein